MGFSLILRAFFSFPNERQFIECQFFWKFRDIRAPRDMLFYLAFYCHFNRPYYEVLEEMPELLFQGGEEQEGKLEYISERNIQNRG